MVTETVIIMFRARKIKIKKVVIKMSWKIFFPALAD